MTEGKKPTLQSFRCYAFIFFILLPNLVQGQTAQGCAFPAACTDCFDWCSPDHCDSLLRDFCKVSCKTCSKLSKECTTLNCAQRCIPSEGVNPARCACEDGFELDADGRTCNDIDECQRNQNICSQAKGPVLCNNTYGSYQCSACKTIDNTRIWSYYGKKDCCLRNHNSQCGKGTATGGRIINGRNSTVLRFPWMALLNVGNSICGGTLISDTVILTAAHCVVNVANAQSVLVNLGVQNFNDPTNIHTQSYRPAKITIHPRYAFPDNDVALIHLNQAVTRSFYVSPVCLPGGETPPVGEKCFATGYGVTREGGSASPILQEVDLPIVSNAECQRAYENHTNDVNSTIHICAGYLEGGRDACKGDSGGPLVCQRCKNCDWYVAGIVSFGRGCARPGYYGVYARVTQFEEWISQETTLPLVQEECVKPAWHEWGPYGDCSVSCGVGVKTRVRFCMNGVAGQPGCIGKTQEDTPCHLAACERSWSSWTNGECSVTCGQGMRFKTRTCVNGNIGDLGCEVGGDNTSEVCEVGKCPTWTAWDPWSACSSTCGNGERTRMRTCDVFGNVGATCEGGSATESENCIQSCWNNWGEWSQCSRTCNSENQTSERVCLFGTAGEGGCTGDHSRTRSCNEFSCQEWSMWGSCSHTCGNGNQERRRRSEVESRPCIVQPCSSWGPYNEWSQCSMPCGGGVQSSTRVCTDGVQGDAGCPGSNTRERPCNEFACNAWTSWVYSECSETCGDGTRTGTRRCTGGRVEGVGCEGSASVTETCNLGCCPTWTSFEEFESCSVTCGVGTQTARRRCLCNNATDDRCEGSATKTRPCETSACPGTWSPWQKNSDCSVTCGSGNQQEIRTCIGGTVGEVGCVGDTTRMQVCNKQACPAKWGQFGAYGACSRTCGGGTQDRTRECIGGLVGTGGCIGNSTESQACNEQSCPSGNDMCSGLNDNVGVCCEWALVGHCVNFKSYMDQNCRRSCCLVGLGQSCASPGECGDLSAQCPQFAANGLCSFYQRFCRQSCGNC